MATRSAASRCSRIKFHCISSLLRCEGTFRLLAAQSNTSQKTSNISPTCSLPSITSLANQLQNELTLSPRTMLESHTRLGLVENYVQGNVEKVINPGMLNHIAPAFAEVKSPENWELPGYLNQLFEDELILDEVESKEGLILSSVLKKRKKKMNKHKYKKRIHRDKAKINTVKYFRLRRKRRRQAYLKTKLKKNIKQILERNPKSDYPNRPYVVHRLKNW